jgi:hypothetical protein
LPVSEEATVFNDDCHILEAGAESFRFKKGLAKRLSQPRRRRAT